MRDQKIQTLVLTALMTALCAVMTMVIKIPSPMGGYFNLGDCAVLLSAFCLLRIFRRVGCLCRTCIHAGVFASAASAQQKHHSC